MIDNIKIVKTEVLSDNWYTLRKVTFEMTNKEGIKETISREAYDRGNGAVILLYNKEQQTVILTRQFRLPSYINGNKTGLLIEACAGIMDSEHPEECIIRETEEETGYKITEIKKIFEGYTSPGSVTELLYFFIASYNSSMKVADGGGLADEHENIEVLELSFSQALDMINNGEIRDIKTIVLLQYLRINNIL